MAHEVGTRRGFPVYERNPSVVSPDQMNTRRKPVRIARGDRLMLVGQDTGEIVGDGHVAFIDMQEVDETQFVKLYLAGVQQQMKLTTAGLKVFELVYRQMRSTPQMDRVEMNYYIVKKYGLDISDRTYQRGLREMLEHSFLYRSTGADLYFVNVDFIFNGNRITLAKSYQIKGKTEPEQLSLLPPVES